MYLCRNAKNKKHTREEEKVEKAAQSVGRRKGEVRRMQAYAAMARRGEHAKTSLALRTMRKNPRVPGWAGNRTGVTKNTTKKKELSKALRGGGQRGMCEGEEPEAFVKRSIEGRNAVKRIGKNL